MALELPITRDNIIICLSSGSEEERAAVKRAHRYSLKPKENAYDIPDPDVTFKLDLPEDVTIGSAIEIKVC